MLGNIYQAMPKCCYAYNLPKARNWWRHSCYMISEHPALPRPNDAWTGHHLVKQIWSQKLAMLASIQPSMLRLVEHVTCILRSHLFWQLNLRVLEPVDRATNKPSTTKQKLMKIYADLGACWMGCTVHVSSNWRKTLRWAPGHAIAILFCLCMLFSQHFNFSCANNFCTTPWDTCAGGDVYWHILPSKRPKYVLRESPRSSNNTRWRKQILCGIMDILLENKKKLIALARQQVAPFNRYSACRLSLAIGVLFNNILCTSYGCGAAIHESFFLMGTCFGGGMRVLAMALEECSWSCTSSGPVPWATLRDIATWQPTCSVWKLFPQLHLNHIRYGITSPKSLKLISFKSWMHLGASFDGCIIDFKYPLSAKILRMNMAKGYTVWQYIHRFGCQGYLWLV